MDELKDFLSTIEKLRELYESAPADPEIKKSLLREHLFNKIFRLEDLALPPRREEILGIISDHPDTDFDFIKRRFYNVPDRTLRYDLKKLADLGLIVKVGKTRGSFYRAKERI